MRSLRTRVILSATLVLTVFIVLTSLALERAFRDSAGAAREERLLGQIYLLMADAEVENGALVLPRELAEPRFGLPESGLYAVVLDAVGERVWESPSNLGLEVPLDGPLSAGERSFDRRMSTAGDGYLVLRFGVSWATGIVPEAYTFVVAEDLAPFGREVARFRGSLAGWLGTLSLLMLAALLLSLHWGLVPLRRVADEISEIEAGRQDKIRGVYPTELRTLSDNLNALLAHEQAQKQRLDHALGELAHSLKTPLAVMRGAVDQEHRDSETAALLEEQLERMDHTVEYQLQRARSGTGAAAGLASPVPIARTAERLAASLEKVYRDIGRTIEIRISAHLEFRGSEGDLMEMLGNLMDNAFKWAGQRLRVTAVNDRDGLLIDVEDDGPGIAQDQARRVLERGARADPTAPGYGIGLAVVRDICEAYGGELYIGRSSLGGALLRVRIRGHRSGHREPGT